MGQFEADTMVCRRWTGEQRRLKRRSILCKGTRRLHGSVCPNVQRPADGRQAGGREHCKHLESLMTLP